MKKQHLRLLSGVLLAFLVTANVSAEDIFTEVDTGEVFTESVFELPDTETSCEFTEPVFEDLFTESADPAMDSETTVICCSNLDDFSENLLQVIRTHNEEEIPDLAASASEFQTARLMVGTDGRDIDFSLFGPKTVLIGSDDYCILQFDTPSEAEAAASALLATEGIRYAEPDQVIHLTDPSLPDYPETAANCYSWGAAYIGADSYAEAIASATTGSVKVAVMDTGMDTDHPHLKPYLRGSFNFSEDSGVEDRFGHGTNVAGIIVSCTQGLSKRIDLYNLRIGDKDGYSTFAIEINAIKKAKELGIKVVNHSYGADNAHSTAFHEAVTSLVNSGCVFVSAAGNKNVDAVTHCPSDVNTPGVITVGNIDESGDRAFDSNYGTVVDCYAPGEAIKTSGLAGSYVYNRGTSMATPHVAALAAMACLANPSYTPSQIENLIKARCAKSSDGYLYPHFGNVGIVHNEALDTYYGYDLNGNPQKSWFKWNGFWYYFGSNYAAVKGKQKIGNTTYFFDSKGRLSSGWQYLNGYWYFFNSEGKMVLGFQYIGTTYYYFDSYGRMAVGWKTIDGKTYYFRENGSQKRGGWKQINGYWYYFDSDGVMQKGLQKIGNVYYYFDTSGKMVTDKTVFADGALWKVESSGHAYRPVSSVAPGIYTLSFGSAYDKYDLNGDGFADRIQVKSVSTTDSYGDPCYYAQVFLNKNTVFTGVSRSYSYSVTLRMIVLSDGSTFLYYQPNPDQTVGFLFRGSGSSLIQVCNSAQIGGRLTNQSNSTRFTGVSLNSAKTGFNILVSPMSWTLGYNFTFPVTFNWNGSSLSRVTTSAVKTPTGSLTAARTLTFTTAAGGNTTAFTLTAGNTVRIKNVYVNPSGVMYFQGTNSAGKTGWIKGQVGSSGKYFQEAMYAG